MELFQNAAEALLKEYHCFLDYLISNEVKPSDRTGHIGKKDCSALNNLFHIVSENYQTSGRSQGYYAVIDYFYFFSVRSGILQIVKKKGKGLTTQISKRYSALSKLSAMEQYILMMAVWLGEYQNALSSSFSLFRTGQIFERIKNVKVGGALSKCFGKRVIVPWLNYYTPEIRLFALFQLIQIEWLDEKVEDKENKFRIKELYLTEEGFCFNKLLQKQRIGSWYALSVNTVMPILKELINKESGDIEEKLMHFWANPVEEGLLTIELKVVVGSCIRKIKIGDQYTLDDLHYLIQKSVHFDLDHLYYFEIGSGTSKRRYFAPECQDEPWLADEVSLAELSLYEGMQLKYIFDFGNQWCFRITVEHILAEHIEECEIGIIKGEDPEQYSDNW